VGSWPAGHGVCAAEPPGQEPSVLFVHWVQMPEAKNCPGKQLDTAAWQYLAPLSALGTWPFVQLEGCAVVLCVGQMKPLGQVSHEAPL